MDPRVRRTRQLLHDALERLLETKDFEAVSIQEIADAATLNRATFYDHYPDKATLLRCHVAIRFQALLETRGVQFDGTCGSALRAIALGVCDYLAGVDNGQVRGASPARSPPGTGREHRGQEPDPGWTQGPHGQPSGASGDGGGDAELGDLRGCQGMVGVCGASYFRGGGGDHHGSGEPHPLGPGARTGARNCARRASGRDNGQAGSSLI